MIYRQNWFGNRTGENAWFPAQVPGNIQNDYAKFHKWGDINFADNYKRYAALEADTWRYRTELVYEAAPGEDIYFVSGGIDYQFDVLLNGQPVFSQEGMFTPVERNLTALLKDKGNILEIVIHPHPKREGAPEGREQADASCKPPVSYGWDWHPRVIPSGIWNDAYLETRKQDDIYRCEPFYTLSGDYKTAQVRFEVACAAQPVIEFFSPEGDCVYSGTDTQFTIENPELWWCNGQGAPSLYCWRVRTQSSEKTGKVGFRRVELVMNEGSLKEPDDFPKTQRVPPVTINLNGRRIFAKGTNWVTPEIFTGTVSKNTYEPLLRLAKEANMNLLRCWGGAGINKDDFYSLCDEMGLMVWQEFPLACNNYRNSSRYLGVLEQEARSIVRGLRRHPSVVLWCGGNELFNSWSGMTQQSHALRLLDKICYEEDRQTPFIPTSPLMGMGHGCYLFYSRQTKQEVYEMFNCARYTAYTEFGVPGAADPEYLKSFIPEKELFPPRAGTAWETHHALGAWDMELDTWLCMAVLERYFGPAANLEELCRESQWLQCEGYKAIFEEARRQSPYCSMALNWCYNEPWKTAANNSIISYPAQPKPAYYAVRDALRPVMPSARLKKFSYTGGEVFTAEIWMLNDSVNDVHDTVSVSIEIGGDSNHILDWETGNVSANNNKTEHTVSFPLPEYSADKFDLVLTTRHWGESRYTLQYRPAKMLSLQ